MSLLGCCGARGAERGLLGLPAAGAKAALSEGSVGLVNNCIRAPKRMKRCRGTRFHQHTADGILQSFGRYLATSAAFLATFVSARLSKVVKWSLMYNTMYCAARVSVHLNTLPWYNITSMLVGARRRAAVYRSRDEMARVVSSSLISLSLLRQCCNNQPSAPWILGSHTPSA